MPYVDMKLHLTLFCMTFFYQMWDLRKSGCIFTYTVSAFIICLQPFCFCSLQAYDEFGINAAY